MGQAPNYSSKKEERREMAYLPGYWLFYLDSLAGTLRKLCSIGRYQPKLTMDKTPFICIARFPN